MNNTRYPGCCYCGELLSENERDCESGSFFSAHFRCVQPATDGQYVVVCVTDGETLRERYTTLKRAESVARYYQTFNPGTTYTARKMAR